MKEKYTKAKKANRASDYHKTGLYKMGSPLRHKLREKAAPKTFGSQIKRTQRIYYRDKNKQLLLDEFGNPRYKVIKHAV